MAAHQLISRVCLSSVKILLRRTLPLPRVALILFAVLGIVPARALNPNLQISQYSHTAWRLQDGVLPSLPMSMAQTTDGYIWIGTSDGLLRFDGVRFVKWKPLQGEKLLGQEIFSLKADRDGSLWVGTSQGLGHLVDGKLTNFTEHIAVIEQIIIDHAGGVWFARGHIGHDDSAGPLCQVQGPHIKCFGAQDGLPFRYAQVLAENSEGFLWVGTDTALARWKRGISTVNAPLGLQAGASQHGVEALWPSKDGSMWVGMTKVGPGVGLQNVRSTVWRPVVTPGFTSEQVKSIALYADAEDSLWIGTTDKGLYRVHNSQVSHFGANEGLSSDAALAIFQDREGSVWVITSEGLDRFRELPVNSFSMRQGLAGAYVRSVFAAKDGAVWVANNGAINILRDGVTTSLKTSDGLPGEAVACIFQDHIGRMWIGVDDKLVVYDKGKFNVLNLPDRRPVGTVDSIAEDQNGDIWAISDSGQKTSLYQVHNLSLQEQTLSGPLSTVNSVGTNFRGGLWFGLVNGDLAAYNDGKIKTYSGPHLRGYNPLRSVSMNSEGTVMGASGAGLTVWRNEISKTLSRDNGLPCNFVGSFVEDNANNLYLYLKCGVVVITRGELERWWNNPKTNVSFKLYDSTDGSRWDMVIGSRVSTRTPDGRLWFASSDVLQMIDPGRLPFNSLPPSVHIEGVIREGKTLAVREGDRMAPHLRSIQFEYTALSFVDPQKVRFRYRLEGLETDWQDVGTRRLALYNDLPPGQYRFHVVASNNDGVWNDTGASLGFYVTPTIYQRESFKVAVVVLALIALWLFYLFRLSVATEQVRVRLTDRIVERERIARELHDTLLQGFQGLVLLFQNVMTAMPSQDPNREMLGRALDRADEVMLDARHSVRDLRSEGEKVETLAEVLTHFAEQLGQQTPLTFSLQSSGSLRLLNPAMRQEACQIGREALSNAYQHSGASKVEVFLVYRKSHFDMSIRDNGKGIPKPVLESGRGGHWGLAGMRERAKTIGGELTISCEHGSGTEVLLSLPAKLAYVEV